MLYKKVILKLSGEALAESDSFGFNSQKINEIIQELKLAHSAKIRIGIVIGAGNIFRARMIKNDEISRVDGDQMGMLATVLNAIYLKNILVSEGIKTRVLSSVAVPSVVEKFYQFQAQEHWDNNEVLIFAGGTGNPYFTTDTAAVLRALEMKAEAVFKITQVEGVYDCDPEKNKDAQIFDKLTYQEALSKRLNIMDMTAFALAQDNDLEIKIFKLKKGNLKKAFQKEKVGTLLKKQLI